MRRGRRGGLRLERSLEHPRRAAGGLAIIEEHTAVVDRRAVMRSVCRGMASLHSYRWDLLLLLL
jgi:hypothetical protein